MPTLRDYQVKAKAAILEKFKTHNSTLLLMATGTGKTVTFADLIRSFPTGRILVLAHRDELIFQAKAQIEAITGEVVAVEKAEVFASNDLFTRARIVVSSIQTQVSGPKGKRRYMRFNPQDFVLVIIDEVHHAGGGVTYREVIDYYRQNPALKTLGVTATGDRADGKGLGCVIDNVAFEYGILDAIQDGYLVDIYQKYVCVESLDYSGVHMVAGDLNEGELAEILEMEENLQGICGPTLEVIHRLEPDTLKTVLPANRRAFLQDKARNVIPRRSIVFTISVLQAEKTCEILSRSMDGVEWVCGKTPKDQRRAILERFATGKTHVVVNCGVLSEGFDNPGVEVIIMARPTCSRALYCQQVGRGTRPLPGVIDNISTAEARRKAIFDSPKRAVYVYDFVDNSRKHKLITTVDILGGRVSPEAAAVAREDAIKRNVPVRILATMSNAEAKLKQEKRLAIEKAKREEAARKAHLVANVYYGLESVDPFDVGNISKTAHNGHSKDGRTFSAKQLWHLRQAGVNPVTITYRQGQAIIAKRKAKPSEKQAKTLKKFNLNPQEFNWDTAHAKISEIEANGWKLPAKAA